MRGENFRKRGTRRRTENKNIHRHRRFGFEKMLYQTTLYHNAKHKSQAHVDETKKKKIDAGADFNFDSHTTYCMESVNNIRKLSSSVSGGSLM
jgi:predicted porin